MYDKLLHLHQKKDMNSQNIIQFLTQLKENNTREWFGENKKWYEEAKKDFELFINQLIPEIAKFDSNIGLLNAKDCLFRIFRDIRFSPDKTPYKTNFGGYMAAGGRKSIKAGYYFHLEPGNSILAGGIYMPQPEVVKKLRTEIYFNAEKFKQIIENKEFINYFNVPDDSDKLKKPPKDFPADFPDIELLKYRSISIAHAINEKILYSSDLLEYSIMIFKAMLPLNRFLNQAIES